MHHLLGFLLGKLVHWVLPEIFFSTESFLHIYRDTFHPYSELSLTAALVLLMYIARFSMKFKQTLSAQTYLPFCLFYKNINDNCSYQLSFLTPRLQDFVRISTLANSCNSFIVSVARPYSLLLLCHIRSTKCKIQ